MANPKARQAVNYHRGQARAPIKLVWFEALRKFRDIPRDSPSRYAVIVVGSILMGYADPDGRNCCPSIHTIIEEAGVSERTVMLVLSWLVEHDWLVVFRRVSRRPTIYRLTIPVPAEEQVPEETPYPPRSRYQEKPVPAVVPAVVPNPEQEDSEVRTSSEEEEESADAPSAYAPVAALQNHTPPLDLFSDGMIVPDQGQGDPWSEDESVSDVAEQIAAHSRCSIEYSRLGPALDLAKKRTGWSGDALAVYCVEKLKAQGRRVRNPSAFLVTDLGRLDDQIVPSPRMELAGVLIELVDVQVEAMGTPAYVPASLPDDLDCWSVDAANIEGIARMARQEIFQTRKRLEEQREREELMAAREAEMAAKPKPPPIDLFAD